MTQGPLTGKTALVTGSARNIGRAAALRLAASGANVIVNAVQDRDAAEAVRAEIEAAGGHAIVCLADVTDRDAVFAMAEAGRAAFGGIDILVANASARGQVPFLEMDHAAWRRVIDISLDGTFHLAQAVLPMMLEKEWGRIVTLGGISWHVGLRNRVNNLVAKSGLTGMTRGLAAEFSGRGITVNMVSPGMIETVRPASAGALPPRETQPPVGRMGTVDEIASAIHFLCLPEQGYTTGQILHVNGGMYYGT
ncbi:MAG TPA: SDR family oxidoreductase [Thermohalobaculum sp.]|nr:SDR family oxidoreductase [Thermohalobaculum sp.]